MGQGPSQEGAAVVGRDGVRCSTVLSVSPDDDGEVLCGGCFFSPFQWRKGCHGNAFEGGDPPDDLVLTDVEDEEEEYEEGIYDVNEPHVEVEEDAPPPPSILESNDGEESPLTIPDDVLSRIVAVDCGMAQGNELRRVSVVDGYGNPLLSALIRVDDNTSSNKYHSSVARYLSNLLPRKSRINKCGDDLDIGVPANQVREAASRLLKGKIVVGHSVDGDLAVLGLGKEKRRDFEVRDTAKYKPFKRRLRDGTRSYRKLSELVEERLDREIQPDGKFHCCEEDAVAALDLYKSVWHEWGAHIKSPTGETKKGESTSVRHNGWPCFQVNTPCPSQAQPMDSPLKRTSEETTSTSQTRDENKPSKDEPLNLLTASRGDQGTAVRQRKKNKRMRKQNNTNSNQTSVATPATKKKKGKKKQTTNTQKSVTTLTKKKQKGKKKDTNAKETPVATTTWFSTLYTALPHCNRLASLVSTLFFYYPILLPLRIIHDLARLTNEMIISVIRLVQHNCSRGGQEVMASLSCDRIRKKRAKKKRRSRVSRRFRMIKLKCLRRVSKSRSSQRFRMLKQKLIQRGLFDTFFLLFHILLEAYTILSFLFHSDGTSSDGWWDISSMHRANGSLALGLAGMHLISRGKKPRNDLGSNILFQILVQYRLICFLLSLIGYLGEWQETSICAIADGNLDHNKNVWLEILADTISQGSLTAAAWE